MKAEAKARYLLTQVDVKNVAQCAQQETKEQQNRREIGVDVFAAGRYHYIYYNSEIRLGLRWRQVKPFSMLCLACSEGFHLGFYFVSMITRRLMLFPYPYTNCEADTNFLNQIYQIFCPSSLFHLHSLQL